MVELFKGIANSDFIELTICRIFSDPVTYVQYMYIVIYQHDHHMDNLLLYIIILDTHIHAHTHIDRYSDFLIYRGDWCATHFSSPPILLLIMK